MNDDRLLRRFRAGDERAFELLHERHRGYVVREIERLGRTRGLDVEVIAQDVFLRAHGALRRNERAVVLRPWLARIARNRCLDALRTRHAEPIEPARIERLAARHSGAGDPAAAFARKEALGSVITRVRALPPRQRTALVAQELDGRSQAELACALGLSAGAFRALVARARRGLKASA